MEIAPVVVFKLIFALAPDSNLIMTSLAIKVLVSIVSFVSTLPRVVFVAHCLS